MKKIITYLNGLCIAGITGILVSCSSSVDQLTATAPEYQKLENLYVRLTNTEQSRNEAYYRQLKKEYYAALVPFWAGKTKMPVGGVTLRICWRVSMESICSICKREERSLLTLYSWKQFMIQQCVRQKEHKKFMKNNMGWPGN